MLNALREEARQSPAPRPGGSPAEELGVRPVDTYRKAKGAMPDNIGVDLVDDLCPPGDGHCEFSTVLYPYGRLKRPEWASVELSPPKPTH